MDFIKSQLRGEVVLFSANSKISSFSNSVLVAAKKVITEIDKRRWNAKELNQLRISVKNISVE